MSQFPLVIAILFATGSTSAGDRPSILMHPQKGCSILPLKERASMARIERVDSKINFTVQANTYCKAEPTNSKLERVADTATISIEYDISRSFHNCYCAKTITFEIYSLPLTVKTIYFVQDGHVTGHGYVP